MPGDSKQSTVTDLDQVLKVAVENGASDVHLVVAEPYLFRIGPEVVRCSGNPLTPQEVEEIIRSLISPKQTQLLKDTHELDFSYQPEAIVKARFRVNVGLENKGLFATFRVIPNEIREISKLGFPDAKVWQDVVGLNKGLVLVTGVTGSGKSTTLASLIQEMNARYSEKIICIEDPIEYVHKNQMSVVIQREVGRDTQSFAAGVKWALRQDPDNILVGEIRDMETARAALTAAETGHLVLTTLHTKDAVGTIRRFVELFPSSEQNEIRASLSDNLAYVLSQQLIPYEIKTNRVLAMEVLRNNFAIANLIREGKIHQLQGLIETGMKEGMITMDRHLQDLYHAGRITRETALFYAANRAAQEEALDK
jgi:twitching motility protein PilT